MGTSAERIARLRGSPLDKWQLYGLILHDHELVPSCCGVAWQLLEHYNAKTGECYPSVDLLAEETGLARSTVFVAVRLLLERGWFRYHPGGGRKRSNQYEPAFERVRQSGRFTAPKGSDTTEQNSPISPGKTVRATGPETVKETVNQTMGNGIKSSQEINWGEQAWWLWEQGKYEKRHGYGSIGLAEQDLNERREKFGDRETLRRIEQARQRGLYGPVLEQFIQGNGRGGL